MFFEVHVKDTAVADGEHWVSPSIDGKLSSMLVDVSDRMRFCFHSYALA